MVFSRDNTKGHGLLDAIIVPFEALKTRLRQLYEGDTFGCIKFRYALLALDIVTVLFIVATSFLPRTGVVELLDIVFGVLILADFSARMIISRQPLHDLARLSTWTDIVVIIHFSRRSPGRPAASCVHFEHCGCYATIKWWRDSAPIAPSSGATRKSSLQSQISACSFS